MTQDGTPADRMDFRRLQWLFPVAVALHNGEEAIWMPRWDARHVAESPIRSPGAVEIRLALVVLTVAAFAITHFSSRRGPQSLWASFGVAVPIGLGSIISAMFVLGRLTH